MDKTEEIADMILKFAYEYLIVYQLPSSSTGKMGDRELKDKAKKLANEIIEMLK